MCLNIFYIIIKIMGFQGQVMFTFLLFYLVQCVLGDDISNSTDISVRCEVEHEYDHLDVRNVTGKWEAVELYMHLSKEGVNVYKSCPRITIWETEEMPISTFGPNTESPPHHVQHMTARFRQEYRNLRLLWDEAGQTIEYAMYFRNDSAGYWQVFHGQNGTLTIRPNYQQFDGTVQVLKAVNDHLVLNFCQEASNGRPTQLYTVLFSREPGAMLRWEIDSVHALLQNKKLSVASRRMVCGNSADRPILSVSFSLISCLLSYVIGKS